MAIKEQAIVNGECVGEPKELSPKEEREYVRKLRRQDKLLRKAYKEGNLSKELWDMWKKSYRRLLRVARPESL